MNARGKWSRRVFLRMAALGAAGRAAFGAEQLAALPTIDQELRQAAKAAALRLIFNGKTTADLAAWQRQFGAELRTRLGPHHPPQQWSIETLSRADFSDHSREELLLKSDPISPLPIYVLVPSAARHGAGPFPIVVALHGHGQFGHDPVVGIDGTPEHAEAIRAANYDYGRQLVREGYLVIAPCMLPFGRRVDEAYRKRNVDPCPVTFVRMMLLGQTLMAANLRDVSWALSYAQSRREARKDRIACVGLSYGGRMTMLAAALDQRINVAVVSGAMNVMQERIESAYSCGAQVIPGLLEIGDTPEIGSLIAPRPCIWEIGAKDKLVKPDWAEKAKVRLNKAYAAAGKPGNVSFHHFDGEHRWDGVTAVPLLAKILKGT